MSVSTIHIKDIIKGDGESKNFPFSFEVLNEKQVKCIRILATGEEVPILETEFEVILDDVGGKVLYPLYDDALADSEKIVIYRDTDIRQDYSPANRDNFDALAIREEVNRATMISQELAEAVSRSVKVSLSGEGNPDELMEEINHKLSEANLAAKNSKESADLSKDYATKMDGKVIEDSVEVDFSSKYYAKKAKDEGEKQALISEEYAKISMKEANRAEEQAEKAKVEADKAKEIVDSIMPDNFADKDLSNVDFGSLSKDTKQSVIDNVTGVTNTEYKPRSIRTRYRADRSGFVYIMCGGGAGNNNRPVLEVTKDGITKKFLGTAWGGTQWSTTASLLIPISKGTEYYYDGTVFGGDWETFVFIPYAGSKGE